MPYSTAHPEIVPGGGAPGDRQGHRERGRDDGEEAGGVPLAIMDGTLEATEQNDQSGGAVIRVPKKTRFTTMVKFASARRAEDRRS
jgi:hypothetical protein